MKRQFYIAAIAALLWLGLRPLPAPAQSPTWTDFYMSKVGSYYTLNVYKTPIRAWMASDSNKFFWGNSDSLGHNPWTAYLISTGPDTTKGPIFVGPSDATGYAGVYGYNNQNKYGGLGMFGSSFPDAYFAGKYFFETDASNMSFGVWGTNPVWTWATFTTAYVEYMKLQVNAVAVDTVKPLHSNMLFLKDSVTVWTLDNLGATNDVKQWADCGHIMSFEGGIRVGATRRNEGYNGPAIKVDYTASMPDQFANVILSLYPGVSSIVASNQAGGQDSAMFVIYGGVNANYKSGLGSPSDTTQGFWAGTDRITSWEPHYFKQGLYGHLYGLADTASTLQGLDTTAIKSRSISAVLNDTALGKLWLTGGIKSTGTDSFANIRVVGSGSSVITGNTTTNGVSQIQVQNAAGTAALQMVHYNSARATVWNRNQSAIYSMQNLYVNPAANYGWYYLVGDFTDSTKIYAKWDSLGNLRIGQATQAFISAEARLDVRGTIRTATKAGTVKAYMDTTGLVVALRCSTNGKAAMAHDTLYYGVLTSRSPADFNVGDCPGDTIMLVRSKNKVITWLDKDGVWHRANVEVAMAENNVVAPGKNNTVIIIILVLLTLSNVGLWVLKK